MSPDSQIDLFGSASGVPGTPGRDRRRPGRPIALPAEIETVIVELWGVRVLTVRMIQVALLMVYGRWVSRTTLHRVVRRHELAPRLGANEERRARPRVDGTPIWFACRVCGHRSPTPTHPSCEQRKAA